MSGEKRMRWNKGKSSGLLNKDVLKRLEEFILEHLAEPLDVATLAKMTNRSEFHFSRAFTRFVGVSPHRYVVRLRLQRAVEMVREGKFSLAEIAAKTGFADQSHLTRWVRRVHGVSPTQLRPNREPNSRNLATALRGAPVVASQESSSAQAWAALEGHHGIASSRCGSASR
jgi:AraC-like DNA-binding protein